PEHHRSIIILSDIEGLAYREIAEVLAIPMGTVMSRLHNARKRLREALGPTFLGLLLGVLLLAGLRGPALAPMSPSPPPPRPPAPPPGPPACGFGPGAAAPHRAPPPGPLAPAPPPATAPPARRSAGAAAEARGLGRIAHLRRGMRAPGPAPAVGASPAGGLRL